ncbi:type IV pilin accessory protein [Acinetobacter sp. A3.8]|uniref:Type IV pilin accessory protein n=1 Tax=Acinetobacter sedimenti TaxID=2919922 RepID=A0A9X1WW76_9GAMM|nr:TfpX/TfpZ family type IV pilin accessory protein [Acinetobacter sedimenti]MCJ8146100.1 type IV pilin accessory protein [Acinetobacter sedimenti]
MSKRLKFFLGHLSVSIAIALLVVGLVFLIWYPTPLGKALGVTQLFLMLVVIDVILGPLLGLLVYKEGKKTLKFDLATVVILQLSALGYGIYSIAEGRPVWIVYDTATFTVIKNSEIETKNIEQAKPEYQKPSLFKPQYVSLNADLKPTMQALLHSSSQSTASRYPIYYTNLSSAKLRMQFSALPIKFLEHYNDKSKVDKVVKKYPQADSWVGLSAPMRDMVVLINKEKGEVVKIVDLRPWK